MKRKIIASLIISMLVQIIGACGVFAQGAVRVYVDCNTDAGEIKYSLSGAAQGGNAYSYLKSGIPEQVGDYVNFVRLEGVGGPGYGLYNTETGEYNFTGLFNEIDKIHATGAEIIADIFFMPSWLSSKPDDEFFFYYKPADYDAWSEYVKTIVRNVNIENNGQRRIDYWEIWNEPSGDYFFRDGFGEFCEFYSVTAKAIKEADPTAKVGGYADNPYWNDCLYWSGVQVNNETIPDFITLHYYAEWNEGAGKTPKQYAEYAKKVQDNVYSKCGVRVPVFYTEWNMNAEGKTYTMANTVSYIAQSLYWMQNGTGGSNPVEKSCFFRIEEYPGAYSLLDANGKTTACGRTFQMFNSLEKNQIEAACSDESTTAIASKDANGKNITIMFSRHELDATGEKKNVSIHVKNHNISGNYIIELSRENSKTAASIGDLEPELMMGTTTSSKDDIVISFDDIEECEALYIKISEKKIDPYKREADSYGVNLFPNSSFEDSTLIGWSNAASASVYPVSGSRALRISAGNSASYTLNGLLPNTDYVLSGYLKTAENSDVITLGVKEHGSDTAEESYSGSKYGYKKLRFKTGENSTSAVVYLTSESGICYVDNLEVHKLKDGASLILNSGFENGETVFSAENVISEKARSGNNCLSVEGGKSVSALIQQLKPQTEYVFSGWVSSEAMSYISISDYGSSQKNQRLRPNSGYTYFEQSFTTGSNYAKAKILLSSMGSTAAYFDDLRLVEKSKANITQTGVDIGDIKVYGDYISEKTDITNLKLQTGKLFIQADLSNYTDEAPLTIYAAVYKSGQLVEVYSMPKPEDNNLIKQLNFNPTDSVNLYELKIFGWKNRQTPETEVLSLTSQYK